MKQPRLLLVAQNQAVADKIKKSGVWPQEVKIVGLGQVVAGIGVDVIIILNGTVIATEKEEEWVKFLKCRLYHSEGIILDYGSRTKQ